MEEHQPLVDYYKVLGVARSADTRAIERAYRQGALRAHPDKATGSMTSHGTPCLTFHELADAYRVLHNSDSRKEYDMRLNPPPKLQNIMNIVPEECPSAVLEGMLEAVRLRERNITQDSARWDDVFAISRDGQVMRRRTARPNSSVPSLFGVSGRANSASRFSRPQVSAAAFSRPNSAIGEATVQIRPTTSLARKPPLPRVGSATPQPQNNRNICQVNNNRPPAPLPCQPLHVTPSRHPGILPQGKPRRNSMQSFFAHQNRGGVHDALEGSGLPKTLDCPLPLYVSAKTIRTRSVSQSRV